MIYYYYYYYLKRESASREGRGTATWMVFCTYNAKGI